jgi:hypothetical protein
MNKHILQLAFALATVVLCAACAAPQPMEGPGMTVTFNNVIKGKKVDVLRAKTSNGVPFVTPGSLGSDRSPNPMTGGKTSGAAPDGRELPEWVEFEWTEWPYPSPPKPTDPVALQAWNDRVDFLIRTLPLKRARVPVRSRVPQDVVDELLASNKRAAAGALPDERLWVYFVWYETGIKFRWSLERGCCKVLRAGGDDLAN